jgi:hypothetical protein
MQCIYSAYADFMQCIILAYASAYAPAYAEMYAELCNAMQIK